MKRLLLCLTVAALCLATTVYAYDMGTLPKMGPGITLRAVVPPPDSAPQTKQWPAALWFDVNGTELVLYAKHLSGYNETTGKGKLMIWVGPPQQYIDEVTADHPYGPADAAKYLKDAGISSVQANIYVGVGNKYPPAPGYQEWNSQADRCIMGIMMPSKPHLLWRPSIWANTNSGKVWLYRGTMLCTCPDYPDDTPTDNWITIVQGPNVLHEVDQWGLPNNSPVPAETTGGTTGGDTSTNPVAHALTPYAGFWYDQQTGLRALISTDGVALLTSTKSPTAGAIGASCGVVRNRLVVRAAAANAHQLWLAGIKPAAGEGLVGGNYCLTTVWDLGVQGSTLAGSMRSWQAQVSAAGAVQAAQAWHDPGGKTVAVTWVRATSKSLEGPAHKWETAPGSLQALYEGTR